MTALPPHMLRAYCEADVAATVAVFKALPQKKRRWHPPVTASGQVVRRRKA